MVSDCQTLASEGNCRFDILTYHEARRHEERIELKPRLDFPASEPVSLHPRAIINATGSHVDNTLQRITVPSERLMGGTKGSHLFTLHQPLRKLLDEGGIYAEAEDGRPVFLLPLGEGSLIGTTDLFYDKDPALATASDKEIEYLVSVINRIFPQLQFCAEDIECHYCGVRPLPYSDPETKASAITRSHVLNEHNDLPWPVVSVIGGKLTTCRSLAEDVTNLLAERLQFPITDTGRDRVFPGKCTLLNSSSQSPDENVVGLEISWQTVDTVLREEHVRTLGDLVERRLMLIYHPGLQRRTLEALAQRMADHGLISPAAIDSETESCMDRLARHFGKQVLTIHPGDR